MGKVNCEACNRSCKGQAIKIQNDFYHFKCFKCKECNKPLATSGFYNRNKFHYCVEDFERLFGFVCNLCSQEITGEVVTAQDRTYHQHCFFCAKCRRNIPPGARVIYNGLEHFCSACITSENNAELSVNIQPECEKENSRLTASAPCTPAKLSCLEDGESKLITLDYSSDDGDGRGRTITSKHEFKNRSGSPASYSHKSRESASRPVSSFGQFLNTSYLELKDNFKRGPTISTSPLPAKHFHKPEKYNYYDFVRKYVKPKKQGLISSLSCEERSLNVRSIDAIERMVSEESMEAILLSRQPDARPDHDCVSAIERDDWPAPPHPAAAYPELMRDVHEKLITESDTDGRISRMKREIDELTKMADEDSGAARVILNNLKKCEVEGITLDPRSASRTPSAAVEPLHRTRYESSLYASPSRDIDERLRLRSLECLNDRRFRTPSKISNDPIDWKEYEMPRNLIRNRDVPRPGYCLSARSSALDNHVKYVDDLFDTFHSKRAESSAAVLEDTQRYHSQFSVDGYDTTTGLKHNLRSHSPTFSDGFMSPYLGFRRSVPNLFKTEEPLKVYTYEELISYKDSLPKDIDKFFIEKHLSKIEFEKLFGMSGEEFYRLPEWKRNDFKAKCGLF